MRARKTLKAHFTDFFTDFEKKKTTVLQSTYFVTLDQCKVSRLTAFEDDIKYQDLIYYHGWKEPMKRT